jgi:glycosyltransferase involved in cell wall biosynthesis
MSGRSQREDMLPVLCVINSLGPGGSERSLAELLPGLMSNGIRPSIVCLKDRRDGVEPSIRELGCEINFLTGSISKQVRHLRRILQRELPRLVHTTLFEADVVGRVAAAGTGIPVLTSFVNTTYDGARHADPNIDRRRLSVVRSIDRLTARHLGTHFHAVSEAVKEDAVRALRLDPERITVIKRGRDAARLGTPGAARRKEARRRLGLSATAEVVLNVGRQEFQKGQRHLVEALELVASVRPEIVCLIAGREGHASPELQRISEQLVAAGRLRFLGHRDDVPELMAAADVVAMPSLYEGCSGVVIEAMALGLPVIASDIPSLREVVIEHENGTLVPPASPVSLAEAVGRLLDDRPRMAALGRRGREIFLERFTIAHSTARMTELYWQVAAGSIRSLARARSIPGSVLTRGG